MRRLLWLALLALPIAACDTGARKDLSDEDQVLDETKAQVYLMPDGFPNLVHKCDGTTGMWTNTDRGVWIVYQDSLCDGSGTGMVLDNIPGSQGATE